jgi:threonine dehydrogenase-like Zn-dependent dehydrogenase
MRGVFCDGSSIQLRRDLPAPTPTEDDVVLKVRRAGICDTDLQLARGYMNFRGILGHEFVGETPEGRRVTAEINNPCHVCPTCRAGRQNHCPHRSVLGILNRDGAMADQVAVPRRNLREIPDAVEDRRAVFIEPLAAAFRMIEQAEIGLGSTIAIVGDGKLGLLCAWVARASGARVTLVGKHENKLRLAGPDVQTLHLDAIESSAHSFDFVADCTGSPTGFSTALSLVRPLGTIILKTTISGDYTLSLAPIVIDEITIIGSRCGPFPRAIAALSTGEIDVTPLIGDELSLDDAEKAFALAAERGAKKILLVVNDD